MCTELSLNREALCKHSTECLRNTALKGKGPSGHAEEGERARKTKHEGGGFTAPARACS